MPQSSLRRASPGLTLGLLAAISTCGFIDRILMNVLVQPIKLEFGLSDAEIGLVNGLAFALLNVAIGLWVARLAERRHRVSLVTVGTLLWSIATAACGLAGGFTALLLARIGVGVGEAVGLPATQSIVSDSFPRERRGSAMAVLLLAPPLGAFIGSAGGALVGQAYGWRSAFWIAAIPGLVFTLLLALLVPEPSRGRHDEGASDTVPPLRAVLARLWRRHTLRHLLAGSTIASMVGFALNAFLATLLLRRFGYSLAQAGVAVGLLTSAPATLGVLGSGWIADRLGKGDARWHVLLPAISLFVAAPLFALAVTRASDSAAVALLTLSAFVQYAYLAPSAALFQNMMGPRMRASATAVTGMVYSLIGGGLGPLLLGAASDHFARAQGDSARGLAEAMAIGAIGYGWAGLHYLLAARRIRDELALPV